MIALSDVPDDFDDFLGWLKDRSEAAWAVFETTTFDEFEENQVGGSSWRTGTRWQAGLEEEAIDAAEQQWGLKFPEDYRHFLLRLNAPDRGRYSVGFSDDPPYGMREFDDEPSYFDWQKDEEAIRGALAWPLEGLVFDVEENALWLESWGERPEEAPERSAKLAELVAAAPPLVPITGHRFLLAGSAGAGNPALSVWGSDIIVYGSNLREFLLLEFSGLVGLDFKEVSKAVGGGLSSAEIAAIPFWGEVMLREWESRNSFL